MKYIIKVLFLLILSFKVQAETQISAMRIWPAPDHTKVVFDLSKNVDYKLDYLEAKSQVLISLPQTTALALLDQNLKDSRLLRLRTKTESGSLIIAFDLKTGLRVKSFLGLPNEKYPHRLIVDFIDIEEKIAPVKTIDKQKKFLVAIDAGHGGEDSGAVGKNGVKEKHVVMAIAKTLQKYINNNPNMQGKLTRSSDYYLSLKKRVKKAEQMQADIFVSIHADAFRIPSAKGASVYILSKHGSSSAGAKWLAEKENAADVIGGVPIAENKNSVLDQVLSELVAKVTYKQSKDVAKTLINGFKKDLLVQLHSRRVEQANFFVLRQNSIPAILIETGFMSNPDEAQYLADVDYQRQLAFLIYTALNTYRKSL